MFEMLKKRKEGRMNELVADAGVNADEDEEGEPTVADEGESIE